MLNTIPDVFIQYGVMGVIAFVFLRTFIKMARSQQETNSLLVNTLINKDKTDIEGLEDLILTLQQTINSHQKYTSDNIHQLTSSVSDRMKERDDICKMIRDHEQITVQHMLQLTNIINEFSSIILKNK